MRCAVIGAGAWGTALADLLATNGHDVHLWAREADVVRTIRETRENTTFLPGHRLADTLTVTDDQREATAGAQLIVYAAPSQHLRGVARAGAPGVLGDAVLAVASKGIEQGTLALMSDVIEEELPGRPVVAISGPSFAAEVAAREPTAIVAASAHAAAAERVQQALSSATFRVYTHDDLIGVELGGSLKNVMAVATGILEGVGLGNNARAALITRGLAEMTRIGVAMGAEAQTFSGLSGIGDLVLTCSGDASRNRRVGLGLGQGKSMQTIMDEMKQVAEGVKTTKVAHELAKKIGVEAPITDAMHAIIYEGVPVREAILRLLTRPARSERD